jgi:cytochrome c
MIFRDSRSAIATPLRAPLSPFLAFAFGLALLTLAGSNRAEELSAAAPPVGDPARGEAVYRRCQGCHSIDQNRVGPKHRGLFGRKAGSLPDFAYSAAMKNSGLVWDERKLDRFLASPRAVVPGTRMTYAGVKDAQERADLIAYLKQATAP